MACLLHNYSQAMLALNETPIAELRTELYQDMFLPAMLKRVLT